MADTAGREIWQPKQSARRKKSASGKAGHREEILKEIVSFADLVRSFRRRATRLARNASRLVIVIIKLHFDKCASTKAILPLLPAFA